jgi:alkylation response protein AidB-like acyl-CoA dehydrogenase
MDSQAAAKTEVSPLEAARRVAPVVRAHSQQAERERRLTGPVVEALSEAGLFGLFAPRSLGGLEADPPTAARVIEEVTAADSAAGWALFNPAAWAFFSARLPDRGAEEIYGGGAVAAVAGPFHPPMQAVAADGGYRITGRSPFVSNCRDARWIATTALVATGGDGPQAIAAYLRADQFAIIDTWDVLGMRGTGSDDVAATDAFVPAARTCALAPEFTPGSHYRGPLYRFSMMGAVAATLAPIALAVARNAIEEVSAIAQHKTPFGSATLLRERPAAQQKIAEAEAALRSARALLYETLGAVWERVLAGEPVSLQQRADLLLAVTNAISSAGRVADLTYSVAGTTGIYARNPLERHFRDLQVLRQHGFASEARYETAGRVYVGLPPDWAPIVL